MNEVFLALNILISSYTIGFALRTLEEWKENVLTVILALGLLLTIAKFTIVGFNPVMGGIAARFWLVPIIVIGFYTGIHTGKVVLNGIKNDIDKSETK